MNTRPAVYTLTGLVGFATAAVSTVSLYRLAVDCSFDWWLAPALPIALDAGATVGALAWITERGPARAWGRTIAVAALIESLAGNGIQHAIEAQKMRPTLALVLAVGATIPATLWAVIHLAALMSTKAPPARRSRKLGGISPPATKTPTPIAPPQLAPPVRGDRAAMVAWASSYPELPSLRAIQQEWNCSPATAKRVRAAAKAAS